MAERWEVPDESREARWRAWSMLCRRSLAPQRPRCRSSHAACCRQPWVVASAAACVLLLGSCMVDEVCYDADDCSGGRICDRQQGECVQPQFECVRREDCADGFRCDAGDCVPDSTGPLVCRDGMVAVGDAYCIDQYEASRPDATATDAGQDTSHAASRPGVLPWSVNPVSRPAVETFAAACERAGKHLCSRDEWYGACAGTTGTVYSFGNVFDRETCNCVDTYCDDYCQELAIEPCPVGPDCGYVFGSFRVMPTGSLPTCVDEYGAYDVNGNVWEVVTSDRDFEVRGGAFNCAGASERLKCTFNAGWAQLYAGFRCCSGPDGNAQN